MNTPKHPALHWRKLTPYAIRSTCERWQICRAGRAGLDETFSLWQRDPDSGRAVCVRVCREGAAEAKALTAELQAKVDA
ncbi:MAG: hypothetical protein GVY22_03985 [Gammaproteobacteria bacterium]|jgi:hypothetical protein|nr:hypothetical protein [Gammaproteobacteria bacterium]